VFHGQFLSKSRTVAAIGDLFGAKIAANTLVSWTTRIAARVVARVIPAITERIAGAAVAHVDEAGFRTAGTLHWTGVRFVTLSRFLVIDSDVSWLVSQRDALTGVEP
jgi:hypothetical protein